MDLGVPVMLDREEVIGVLWEDGNTEVTGEVEGAVILDLGVPVMVEGEVWRRVS